MTLVPDCFLSILSDIDGSLRLRLRLGRLKLALVSCTTISVYVNVSKSKPPRGARPSSDRLRRGGHPSFAGAKVRLFLKLAKLLRFFFQKEW